jgi:hypothetical protein
MKQNLVPKVPKSSKIFFCNKCNYNTSRHSQYTRHLNTTKHKNVTYETNVTKVPNNQKTHHICNNCNNIFNNRTALWRHKKICMEELLINYDNNTFNEFNDNKEHTYNSNTNVIDNMENDKLNEIQNTITPKLVMELLKNTKNLQDIVLLQNETIKEQNQTINNIIYKSFNNGINNITNSNNNNKTFNLQFFLNETCKDAMNLTDFVNSIKLRVEDLITIGEVGYIKGISNIINENLQRLDITERPLHCTDKKRETIYSKENDKWEKEDDNKTKLRNIIKNISFKNIYLLKEYREKYPEYKNSSSIQSDIYDKLLFNVMGGKGDNNKEKEDKIISNIAKNIIIKKI